MATAHAISCAFCGREFTPCRAGVKFCSVACNKKAWTARRSERRRAAHRTAVRTCEHCGRPFEWDSNHGNRRFCSGKCKKSAELLGRSASRTRRDIVGVKAADALPEALDGLRAQKDRRYFKTLFSLPEAYQFAEMNAWTPDDHALAARYLGVLDDVMFGAQYDEDERMAYEISAGARSALHDEEDGLL